MKTYDTPDIKLASILVAFGIPLRKSDPVTCVMTNDRPQYSIWFDITDHNDATTCQKYVDAWYSMRRDGKMTLDPENPLYWMKGALENREVLLNWMRNDVEPMRLAKVGKWHVLMSDKQPEAVIRKLAPYIKS